MLNALHESLRKLLAQEGFDPHDVGVEFEIPNRNWAGGLAKPTINFFLQQLEENTTLRRTTPQVANAVKSSTSTTPPRRINLRYQVAAFTSDVRDQYELLWRLGASLMRHPVLPKDILPTAISDLGLPVVGRVLQPEDNSRDAFAATDLPPRPSLVYVVTLPLDLGLVSSAPLVLTRRTDLGQSGYASRDTDLSIGGFVYTNGAAQAGVAVWLENSAGAGAISDAQGRYVLHHVVVAENGEVALRVAQPGQAPLRVVLHVPSGDYDVHLDNPLDNP